MAKRKKVGSKRYRSYQAPGRTVLEAAPVAGGKVKTTVAWLASTGFVLAAASAAYDFFAANLSLTYSKPLGQGYEIIVTNDGPSDRVIDTFRITFPPRQQVIYTVTQDTLMQIQDGKAVFPGGPVTWVPAAEFKELDGQAIGARSQLKFRVPPLSDKSWLLPQATLLTVRFSSVPANPVLRTVEQVLRHLHLVEQETALDFLVVDNYWSPVKQGALKDAITQACREDGKIAAMDICRSRQR